MIAEFGESSEQAAKKTQHYVTTSKDLEDSYKSLVDQLYPVIASQEKFREEMDLLDLAAKAGAVTDLADAQQRLRESYMTDQSWQDVYGFVGDTQQAVKELEDAGRDLGMTFSSAFEGAIVEGENLRSVMQGLLDDIQRIVVRQTITEPMAESITSALGGAFNSAGTYGGGTVGNLYGGGGGFWSSVGGFLGGLFEDGGYTGPGGKHDVAGLVHAGEFVIQKSVVEKPGMRQFLNNLNEMRGYSSGGYVGPAASGPVPGASAGSNVTINAPVTVQAQPGMSNQEALRQGTMIGQAIRAEVRKVMQDEMRPGGMLSGGG